MEESHNVLLSEKGYKWAQTMGLLAAFRCCEKVTLKIKEEGFILVQF